jgi:hypothetical protein
MLELNPDMAEASIARQNIVAIQNFLNKLHE